MPILSTIVASAEHPERGEVNVKATPGIKADGRVGTLSFTVTVRQDGNSIVLSGPPGALSLIVDGRPDRSTGPDLYRQLRSLMEGQGMWLGPAQDPWSTGAAKPRPPTLQGRPKGVSDQPLQGGAMETSRRRH
jgi:hypothetical protein